MPHSKMLIFFTLAICLFIPAVAAATPTAFLVVTINTDNSDSFGCTAQHCTLREAVVAANASTNVPDAILIPSSVGTITLTQGQLLVTDALTILGTGDRTTILANNASRHFEVAAGIPLTLENLRLEDGVADNGGAILNRGDLVLDNMEIYSNQAVKPGNFGDGGGIYNTGTGDLTLQNDTIVFTLVSRKWEMK